MNIYRDLFQKGEEEKVVQPSRSEKILEVISHYRTYHPRAAPKPSSRNTYWRSISARINEGFSVEDLKQAIDGCCNDPWHVKVGKLEMTYIFRSDEKVNTFMDKAKSKNTNSWHEGMFE